MLRRSASSKAIAGSGLIATDRNGRSTAANGYGREAAALTRRRVLLIVGPLGMLFLLLHLLAPARDGLAHLAGNSYARLPGFGLRSAHSRRTDTHLRAAAARRRASAACASSGQCRPRLTRSAVQGSAYPPANFSDLPPFTFCPTHSDSDELTQLYGSDALLKTRHHVGSSDRIRKVIRRAMAGLPISASHATRAT